MKPPIPGSRSREQLQEARENFTFARNPMPDANLKPGGANAKPGLKMETTLARKWEKP